MYIVIRNLCKRLLRQTSENTRQLRRDEQKSETTNEF